MKPYWKRPEVIILFLVSLGIAGWVLWKEIGPKSSTPPSQATGEVIRITKSTLFRDYGNARLEIEAQIWNSQSTPIVCEPPHFRLVKASPEEASSATEEIPTFFLASSPPAPVLPPGKRTSVTLRYWLEESDLSQAITLVGPDGSAQVKSAEPFDLKTLENQTSKQFRNPLWKSSS